MKLNFTMFLVLFFAHGGSKPWEKPAAFGAEMETGQWYLPLRKLSCKQHALLVQWLTLVT